MEVEQAIFRINNQLEDIKQLPKELLEPEGLESVDFDTLKFVKEFLTELITNHFPDNEEVKYPFIYIAFDKMISIEWDINDFAVTTVVDPEIDYLSVSAFNAKAFKMDSDDNYIWKKFNIDENLVNNFADLLKGLIK